ncbi:MAG: amino acid permease, partial [bacterium]|nr:amino acid permease [bacterium]
MAEQINTKSLDRYLSFLDVWGMAFGCMVGWGAFVMPGTTFLPVAGVAGTLIAMAISLAVMLIIGSSLSYLMVRFPWTGGVYSYTKAAFGREHAFLCSWFLCLSYLTVVFLNGTALFLVIHTLMGSGPPGEHLYTVGGNPIYLREIALSVLALTGVGLLFIVAKPVLQRLNTVLAIILCLGILAVLSCCLPQVLTPEVIGFSGFQGISQGYGIFSIVILAPWAFVGFEVVSFDTAHFKFPVEKAPRVVLCAILLAALAYMAMLLVSVSAVPDRYVSLGAYFSDLGNLQGVISVPTFYAARTLMGSGGLALISLTAMAAILTGIIGAYRAMLRVLSTMAEDKILSDKFAKTSYSILFVMVLSILISLLGRNTLNWFVDLTSFGAIVAYGYTSAAAYQFAKAERNRRIMAIGIIGTLIAVLFGVVQLVPRLAALEAMGSEAFLLLSLWCLLGFAFYWRTVERSSLTEYSSMSTAGAVLFSLLVYAALMWMGKLLVEKGSLDEVRQSLFGGGIVLFLLIFFGLLIMLYIQSLVRTKQEAAEREKIRAIEGSLAKSRFLFNMSHDIRTPMNAIIGYTNLALQEPDGAKARAYLSKIKTSSQSLLSLINDILEMSRIEKGILDLNEEPTDIGEVLEEMRDVFGEQMRQKHLEFTVSAEQVQNRWVLCDKKSLNRVLLNVVSNAYKFTPAGGRVSVTMAEVGSADGCSLYDIRVQDSGIGMSEDFAEKMFNVFERERTSTDSGLEGAGLGLPITKSIVDLMGGTIEVRTSPGNGTEIIIHVKFRLTEEQVQPPVLAVNDLEEGEEKAAAQQAPAAVTTAAAE